MHINPSPNNYYKHTHNINHHVKTNALLLFAQNLKLFILRISIFTPKQICSCA